MEEMFLGMTMKVVSSVAVVAILSWILYVYGNLWLNTQRVRRKLRIQGVRGPPPSFLHGNLPDMQRIKTQASLAKPASTTTCEDDQFLAHDYSATLFPYFEHWRKQYGLLYTYSTGMKQHLYVNEPDLVKEMNQCITLDLGKPSYVTNKLAPMLGNGILRANGHSWAQQRKIVAAEFFMDKVKGMVGLMIDSAQPLLLKWEQFIEEQGGVTAEVKVDADLRGLSADVISRVCFGHSYSKGKQVFSKLRSIQKIMSKHGFLFGQSSFLEKLKIRSKKENEISSLEKEIESLIWELVEERKRECSESETCSLEKDLMQLLLEAAMSDQSLGKDFSKRFIVDNCKNIYFAGHETTAVAASWCLMLLALHPEWQSRIRTEVAQHCLNGIPDADSLPLLKTVTMVIQEVLRLYPPAAFVSREAYEDIQIGNLNVPKGVCSPCNSQPSFSNEELNMETSKTAVASETQSNNGKPILYLEGKGFLPSHTAANGIVEILKSHFTDPWVSRKKIPVKTRDEWFEEFKLKFSICPPDDWRARKNFDSRGADYIRPKC